MKDRLQPYKIKYKHYLCKFNDFQPKQWFLSQHFNICLDIDINNNY